MDHHRIVATYERAAAGRHSLRLFILATSNFLFANIRKKPYPERIAVLRKVLRRTRGGIQYVEHTEGDDVEIFKGVCTLGLEGVVSLDPGSGSKNPEAERGALATARR